jgi:serine-type D-Ala-D-Ala carboxypeptidase (penicillin-binding protein 5/6)
MNETARDLGAVHSNFVNPHGLHDDSHYTTAFDLALIARGALANPTLRQMAATREFVWPGKNNGTYYNHNAMLFTYDGTVGGKNGFTEQARLTLVSSAERNGQFLIGVVLGVDSRSNQYNDMTSLLDFGFNSFETRPVIVLGMPQGSVKIDAGVKDSVGLISNGSVMVSARRGEEPWVTLKRTLPESISAPITAGQKIGVIQVLDGDRVVGSVDIVAEDPVDAKPLVWEIVKAMALATLKWLGSILLGLAVFRMVVKMIRRAIRSRKRRQTRRRPVPDKGPDPYVYSLTSKGQTRP